MNTHTHYRGSLFGFFMRALVLMGLLTLGWSQVSRWTSMPVAWLTQVALEVGTGDWVRTTHSAPGVIEVETRLEVRANGRVGDVVVDADPGHFAYGLPLLWSLLLAAGGPRRWQRMLGGMCALWPAQSFSLMMDLLRKMATAVPGGAGELRIDQWQYEAIALGYQTGTLIVPTLVPILLWVWMDQVFVRERLLSVVRLGPAG